MKQRYTLEDVHTYTQDVIAVQNELSKQMPFMNEESIKQVYTQLHVMREVVLRMHESLEKYGPVRPSLLERMFTAWQIRISGTDTLRQFDFGKMGTSVPPLKKREK